MLQRLPLAKWIFTTLGSSGAVLVQRCPKNNEAGKIAESADFTLVFCKRQKVAQMQMLEASKLTY